MKKLFFILIAMAIGSSFVLHAQSVGVNADGSPADASAMLDIKSTRKGILIPRVQLTGINDVTTIEAPSTSLLVYNMAAAGSGGTAVEPGYYYFDGAGWIKLLSGNGAASSWKIGGNSGTIPGNDFIGTTDNKSLQFKVNNLLAGHIDITNINTFFGYQAGKSITTGWGSIGIGQGALANATSAYDNIAIGEGTLASNITAVNNIAIGKFAMTTNTAGIRNVALGNSSMGLNTSGNENIAIGGSTLYSNTTGSGNSGLGFQALAFNTTGSSNTALGRTAIQSNTTGYENTAVGRSALYNNTTGFQNTAVGRDALTVNTSGRYNSALGYYATTGNVNDSNATVIGARAYSSCNDCMVLGSVAGYNGATKDVNVGIGNIAPTQPLSFRPSLGGKISLWNFNSNNHYGLGVQSGLLQFYTDIANSDFAFGYGNSTSFTESVRIKNNGSIGIGTNPVHALDIRTNTDFNRAHIRLHEPELDFARLRVTNTANTFWDMAARPENTNANAYFNFYYSGLGMNILSLRGDGSATLAGTLAQNSDQRLKRNIIRIPDALEKIMDLNGYNYYWNDDLKDQSLQSGIIAQEVQQVMPGLVKEDEKGILSVNYSGLIPVLIEGMKTQQNVIDSLKKELEALRSLKAELDEIKKTIKTK